MAVTESGNGNSTFIGNWSIGSLPPSIADVTDQGYQSFESGRFSDFHSEIVVIGLTHATDVSELFE